MAVLPVAVLCVAVLPFPLAVVLPVAFLLWLFFLWLCTWLALARGFGAREVFGQHSRLKLGGPGAWEEVPAGQH